MRLLSEKDIVFLDKLRRDNPEAYKRKLQILGLQDYEVPRPTVQVNVVKPQSYFNSWNSLSYQSINTSPFGYSNSYYDDDDYYDDDEYYDDGSGYYDESYVAEDYGTYDETVEGY